MKIGNPPSSPFRKGGIETVKRLEKEDVKRGF
jgi:hypothetical protein